MIRDVSLKQTSEGIKDVYTLLGIEIQCILGKLLSHYYKVIN